MQTRSGILKRKDPDIRSNKTAGPQLTWTFEILSQSCSSNLFPIKSLSGSWLQQKVQKGRKNLIKWLMKHFVSSWFCLISFLPPVPDFHKNWTLRLAGETINAISKHVAWYLFISKSSKLWKNQSFAPSLLKNHLKQHLSTGCSHSVYQDPNTFLSEEQWRWGSYRTTTAPDFLQPNTNDPSRSRRRELLELNSKTFHVSPRT